MRMLAYGSSADSIDENIRMSEITIMKCIKRFVQSITDVFGEEYLRRPNVVDVQRLMQIGEQRGFPGTLNDINVLHRSPIFHKVLEDGIYPSWATFVKSIPLSQSAKHKLFAKKQEAARKDIERAFGVLKARFAIISNPARMGSKETLGQIMRACIIIHNMIVEDERDSYAIDSNYTNESVNCNVSTPKNSPSHFIRNEDYIQNHAMIRNRPTNHQLREDLIEEIRNRFGGEEN
ncbi:PREDICTED: uncharacterized protein LOC109157325 [Ipomoea nil]|uniref:uncharacterized protein LOC109157325 n=1 Tax=Ipomoea nil TaxID=35883 RepID=UPI000901D373|nr:PREDICTED: uncharacterized protein LOC109157325 [Ipomoea nil]